MTSIKIENVFKIRIVNCSKIVQNNLKIKILNNDGSSKHVVSHNGYRAKGKEHRILMNL